MAFDLKKQFDTNEQLEIEGVWEDLDEAKDGEDPPGILVARVGNKAYLKEYQKVPAGLRRQLDNGTLPDGVQSPIINKLLARTILLDWRGIVDDGEPIGDYCYEEGVKYLSRYKDFREFVWSTGNDLARFRDEDMEEDSKNSVSVSAGNS